MSLMDLMNWTDCKVKALRTQRQTYCATGIRVVLQVHTRRTVGCSTYTKEITRQVSVQSYDQINLFFAQAYCQFAEIEGVARHLKNGHQTFLRWREYREKLQIIYRKTLQKANHIV